MIKKIRRTSDSYHPLVDPFMAAFYLTVVFAWFMFEIAAEIFRGIGKLIFKK